MLPTGHMPEYYRDAKDIVWKAEAKPAQKRKGLLTRLFSMLRSLRSEHESANARYEVETN